VSTSASRGQGLDPNFSANSAGVRARSAMTAFALAGKSKHFNRGVREEKPQSAPRKSNGAVAQPRGPENWSGLASPQGENRWILRFAVNPV
jgi:hypothetical protein